MEENFDNNNALLEIRNVSQATFFSNGSYGPDLCGSLFVTPPFCLNNEDSY